MKKKKLKKEIRELDCLISYQASVILDLTDELYVIKDELTALRDDFEDLIAARNARKRRRFSTPTILDTLEDIEV